MAYSPCPFSSLEGSFDPAELRSDYRASLKQLLEAKLDGQVLELAEPVADEAPVVDLMEALRASVAANKSGDKGAAAPKKPAARRKRAAAT